MKPADIVIRFASNGSARCLWTEAIDLSAIGRLRVHRASRIEYDNTGQRWVVKIKGKIVFWHASREACLDYEHRALNIALLTGSV